MAETVNQGATNGQEQGGQAQDQAQKTFTQDELNAVINDRLKREKEKYADYAALKEKADRLDKLEEENKSELQKANDRAEKLQKELDDLKNAQSIRDIRDKVAKETGVPAELLSGSTEEECKTQANGIKAYANPGYPQVQDGGEPGGQLKVSTAQQFADWANKQV